MKTSLFTFFIPTFAAIIALLAAALPATAQTAGSLDTLNSNIAGSYVLTTAIQSDGKIIIGGSFSSVLGVPRSNLARLNVDGSLDLSFDPKANFLVNSVVLQNDGKILIGGRFTTLQPNGIASAIARQWIARLNSDGSLDAGFNPKPDSDVSSIALQADGKIVIAGFFSTLQPNLGQTTARNKIARINSDGSLDMGFNPKANDWVCCVAVQEDGKILFGGQFTSVQPNGAASATVRNRIARVNADGSLDTGFDPNAQWTVHCIAIQADQKIVIGGQFSGLKPNGALTGTSRPYIARCNADGSLDPNFSPNANNHVYTLTTQADGKILLGGIFTTLQPIGAATPTMRNRIARVNSDGSLDAGFDPNANNEVRSVAVQANGKILLGGLFSTLQPNGTANAISRNYLARLHNDPATQTLSASDRSLVVWQRGGSSPELSRVTFEQSIDGGSVFTPLGSGTRVGSTANWQISGLSLPVTGKLRARGHTFGGVNSGSSGILEAITGFAFPPTVATTSATALSNNSATLNATVSSNGGATDASFQYSTSANLVSGVTTTTPISLPSGAVDSKLSLPISGLRPHTRYYFRIRAINSGGTAMGTILSFDTTNTPPSASDETWTATTGDQKTVLLPATDADGDALFVTGLIADSHITVNSTVGRSVTFTPSENYTGVTTLTYTVSDGFGGSASGTITVTIADNDSPIIGGSFSPLVIAVGLDGTVAMPDYTSQAVVSDNVGVVSVTQSPPAGESTNVGATRVTLEAVDAAGNMASTSFDVAVNDTTPPSVSGIFSPLTLVTGAGGTVMLPDYRSQAVANDNVAVTSVTQSPASATLLSVGTTQVTLTALDASGNTGNTNFDVLVSDGTPPRIDGPFPSFLFAGTIPDYRSQATDNVGVSSVTQTPHEGSTIIAGEIITVTISASDAAGNHTSRSFEVIVRPTSPVNTALFSTGDAAPGAGVVGGPPSDALLTSLGVPAVDDAGGIAFLGKWSSASEGRGSGVFTETMCVAKAGATFKTFADPVVGGGHVAFRATLAGVPAATAQVVVSGLPESADVLAQAGTVAPGSDGLPLASGTVFKSFQAVAVEGDSVAVFATLGGGSGAGRVTAGSDCGLWLKDATHPLTLVLREGQMIGLRTIKTLVAFTVGDGSPGQGRGWLTQSETDGPQVLALAIFTGTDKAQAVLSVGFGGVSVLSRNGPGGVGGPDAGDSFASYGVPAANSAGKSAFLGSLMVGGTVTKANARGIFVDYGNATYTTIARVTQQAGETGATFGTLKDPVFSADDGVAFPATLKGSTVRGLASTTLWWKPADSDLKLLAQGGKRPGNDLPADAQWKTFPSLAIAAGRGPIFKAMLVTGKGGVTSTTASGVWAVDFTGAPRLLFRTGDMFGDKKLNGFTLLNATVASMGVTRSFNSATQVVWLATFTDKSTAIFATEVP